MAEGPGAEGPVVGSAAALRNPHEVHLRDGTRAWIFPLLKTDRAALAREFETLSPESRRRRFLAPVLHLSEAMLDHLVDDVDGIDHIALVCMAQSTIAPEDGEEPSPEILPVGIARIVRYPDPPDAADLAVTVKDDWQGRGVATALLSVLMPQRPAGVTHILTEVVSDNPASFNMLRRLGEVHIEDPGSGTLEVEVDLDGGGRHPAGAPVPSDRRRWLHTRDRLCPWLA